MSQRPPPSERPPREPQALADVLPRILDELGLGSASHTVRLLRAWDSVLGPELASHCRARGVQRGVVYASVPDSAWMQRVQMHKSAILARLSEALGGVPLRELRMRVEAIGPRRSSEPDPTRGPAEPDRSESSD